MAKKRNIGYKNLKGSWEETNEEIEKNLKIMEDVSNSFSRIFSLSTKLHLTQEQINASSEKMKMILDAQTEAREKGFKVAGYAKKRANEEYSLHKKTLRGLERKQKIQQGMLITQKLMGKLLDVQGSFYKYLMQADSAIRSTNLELGLSGEKAMLLRDNFQQAAKDTAYLGTTLKDIRKIQTGFADETGRARVLSNEMLSDINLMGRGTGLGIQNASKLAGQFDLMGVNIDGAMTLTRDTVEVSERMGVNTTKVFKNISSNFKKLQKMTFQQGVKGFAEMATYAEKFKIDMGSMLDSTEKARTLKGAVEMAAQLQVMGGEFAKSDPFELLFLSRNDPAAYSKKINEMTKGIITWKKNADGSFEHFLSPADRDRLEAVGKAMGLQTGELTTQAHRMADITKMRQQMSGLGLDEKEMSFVEGLNPVLGKNGKFQIMIGNEYKDIGRLTKLQIEGLEKQSISLKERAKQALTFDKVFEATINSFKASLLPILDGVNIVLEFIRPLLEKGGFLNEYGKIIGGIGVAVGGLYAVSKTVAIITASIGGISQMFRSKKLTEVLTQSNRSMKARGAMASGVGRGAMMRGAGVGAAGLGIGAGIGVAAAGISTLADSLKDLDVKKIRELNYILMTLGTTTLLTLGAGLFFVGKASEASIVGLAILGATSFAIGAGIGVAAAGIGFMAQGFATLSGVDLSGVATDILAIGAAAGGGGFLAMFGIGGMAGTATAISSMASNAAGMKQVGDAFKNINVVMNGNVEQLKEVKDVIESIASSKISSGNPISQLANLLSKPLKVEFADKEVALAIELSLDSDVIYNKTIKPKLNRVYDDTVTSQQKGYS